jgi:simple sugar transport system permease protein
VQSPTDKLQIGLVTDAGRIDDGTFNQLAYEGLIRAAEEHELEVEVIETEMTGDHDANIRQLIERGCGLIVTPGSAMGPTVERLARRHPDIRFLVVDYEPLPDSDNVTGIVFAEDQAGFLAGALAGLMTQQGAVGFVGGGDVVPVRKYHRGFEHGLALTNRSAEVRQTYTGSFTDLAAGVEAAEDIVKQGADVVFAAGGECGSAAIQTAAREGAWVIGVDQDEWNTTFQGGNVEGADRLLTSAMKRVGQAVEAAIGQAVKGELTGGVTRFSLENDGVGLAPYHEADVSIPSEVRGKILEVTEGLRSGNVKTEVGPMAEDLRRKSWLRTINWRSALQSFLAIFTALVVGALFIAVFDSDSVWPAFREGVGQGLVASVRAVAEAYGSLFEGAFGNPVTVARGIGEYFQDGSTTLLMRGIRPLTESLRIATPYIFAGLAVALGFQCGLFNIGAEGQYFIGGLASVYVGYSLTGLPWFIHLPLAILAGMAGGAVWAAIVGYLKAKGRGHEVINTIMLNYIAYRLADYLLQVGGPMARPNDSRPVSPMIQLSAYLPQVFPDDPSSRLNVGLLLALAMVGVVYWLLFKTTLGFEIRSVGANPRAARTAGINVARNFVLAMGLSGALAGLAGAHDILGVLHYMPNAFFSGYGFDSIALALLGKSRPVGVMGAAILFGLLRAGAQRMQGPPALVPIDIISILQALIIIFIAAPEVIRVIYRLKTPEEAVEAVFSRGWGKV